MPALALVADDEPMIRRIVATFLGDRYEVTPAADGTEAERLLASPGFAVAVLDCNMPGTEGTEVLARARAAGCRVPVLLVSGLGDGTGEAIAGDPLSAYLPKPFTRDALVRAVEELCARAG